MGCCSGGSPHPSFEFENAGLSAQASDTTITPVFEEHSLSYTHCLTASAPHRNPREGTFTVSGLQMRNLRLRG